MKTIALLCISASLLMAAAVPANADPAGRYSYAPRAGYHAAFERQHEMPRWLYSQRSFRDWHLESQYAHRSALSWASLYDVYRADRRHARRDYRRRNYNDRYYNDNYFNAPRTHPRRRRH